MSKRQVKIYFIRVVWALALASFMACIPDSGSSGSGKGLFNASSNTQTEEETTTPEEETPTVVQRPDGAIFIENNYCVCQNQESIIFSDQCTSICAGKPNTTDPILYGSVTLGEQITLNADISSLYEWCTVRLNDEDANAQCMLSLQSESGSTQTREIIIDNSEGQKNNFSVNLQGVATKTRYIMKLVEQASGASTSSAQMYLTENKDDLANLGLLEMTSVNRYSCLYRYLTKDSQSQNVFTSETLWHYFFDTNTPPTPLPNIFPPGEEQFYCHDINRYPGGDRADYPRLNLTNSIFYMWSKADPRFSNAQFDVNNIIKEKMLNDYSENFEQNLFYAFNSYATPPLNVVTDSNTAANPYDSNANSMPILGYLMVPFVDQDTAQDYCPDNTHYESNTNNIFKVLKELIGVETEGIFFAEEFEPRYLYDASGNPTSLLAPDKMLISETELRKVWFFQNGQQNQTPSESDFRKKDIFFYYPPNYAQPLVRNAGQRIYKIRALGSGDPNNPSTGAASNIKRIGCIPKGVSN